MKLLQSYATIGLSSKEEIYRQEVYALDNDRRYIGMCFFTSICELLQWLCGFGC